MSRRVITIITISESLPNACRIQRDWEWAATTNISSKNINNKFLLLVYDT